MNIKNNLLMACVLFVGIVFGQETEFEGPPPPAPPMRETIEESSPVPPPVPRSPREIADPKSEIVDFPDVEAQYPGGVDAMKKFIQDNVHYPVEDLENNVQGRVYVVFIVEPDGSLSNIEYMRGGVSPTLNREAGRLIRSMPLWIPGKTGGKKVRSRCRLPITFTLSSDEEEGPKKKRKIRR